MDTFKVGDMAIAIMANKAPHLLGAFCTIIGPLEPYPGSIDPGMLVHRVSFPCIGGGRWAAPPYALMKINPPPEIVAEGRRDELTV